MTGISRGRLVRFLVWAIADFAVNRRRDRVAGTVRIAGPVRNDAIAVAVGVLIWAAILRRVHQWVIGVSPLLADGYTWLPTLIAIIGAATAFFAAKGASSR